MVEFRATQLARRVEPAPGRRPEACRHHEAAAWRPDIQLAFSGPRS